MSLLNSFILLKKIIIYFIFLNFLISKKLSTCQVKIVSRVNVNVSVMCQFMVVLFFLFN